MYLTEQHIISKQHSLYKECDRLCFLSKQLYNHILWTMKNEQEETGKMSSAFTLYHKIKSSEHFKTLPNDIAKEVIFQARENWDCFFKALKSWKQNKQYFTSIPEPPKFKKFNGRNVLTIPIRCCRLKKREIHFNKHLTLKVKTKVDNLVEVKIVPQSSCFIICICYKKEEQEKVQSSKAIAIDLGLNNLATIVNNFDYKPIIITGKPIKSVNQFYNKRLASLQSNLQKNHKKRTSNKTKILTLKRNNKIRYYLHHISRYIVEYSRFNNISQILIGYNKGWKQDINIGSVNNQKFTQIPYQTLINQIKYKAELAGISVLTNEESYTSKCSALDREPIQKHESYLGKRVKRGLFKSGSGITINADVNGAANIGRKVFGDDFILSDRGLVVSPLKVNPLKRT